MGVIFRGMNVSNIISIGLKEIWAHKFRSLLTMLGIILGVSSLVAMSAMVKGLENGLKEGLVALGGLEKVRVEQQQELPLHQRHLMDQAVGITMRDVIALQNSAPLVSKITPSVDVFGFRERTMITYGGKAARPWNFVGTWPSALELEEHVIAHGRMFNEIDDEMARSVCVIGTGIRDELFGSPEMIGEEVVPLGEIVNISGRPFTIIGMFQHYEGEQAKRERLLNAAKPQPTNQTSVARGGFRGRGGHFAFRMKNNTVFIPLNTMLLKFRSSAGADSTADPRLSTITMKIPSVDLLETSLQQARNVLMLTHKGIEDFTFRTQEEFAKEITTAITNARMSGSIIAAIALIVGGIGIMNIMLASISERVREIGIRKAVGATTDAIFIQILIESVVIAVFGGIVGLLASFGVVYTIASFTPTDNAPVVTLGAMLLAFTCSVCVGVAAGLFPAFKASRLHPIQALRYE